MTGVGRVAQPGGPDYRIYNPPRQGVPAIPQTPGTHFDRLLRPAWPAVELSFPPSPHGDTSCFDST